MNKQHYEEDLITCPYDPAHRLLKHRFIIHLVKCRRNYEQNNGSMVPCLYNGSHVVHEPEINYHMENCPDRVHMDNYLTAVDDSAPKIEINLNNNPRPANEENWDSTPAPSYDPEEYCKNHQIIRRLDTASKAEKKKWHQSERLRFQELENVTDKMAKLRPPGESRNGQRPKENVPTPAEEEVTPPLSEILANAKKPNGLGVAGDEDDEEKWQKVPSKGRGRGRKIKP